MAAKRSTAKPAAQRASKRGAPRRRKPRDVRAAFLRGFDDLLGQVEAARQAEAYPFYTRIDEAEQGNAGTRRGEPPIIMVANDYLGLAGDPRVAAAARQAIADLGTSRCASPLAGGYTSLHARLETHLAAFLEQEAATLFASGYQANVGVISALVGRGDLIISDLFDHASIVDGARLSGAEVRFFQHNSPKHLESILAREDSTRRVLIAVEGIYSADGDIARIPELCAVAHAHGALLLVDEAHSLGVLGHRGAGAAEYFGMLRDVDVIVGTMSKSLSSVGGFVAADVGLIDVIRHSARALIFSAALPPANAAAALTALQILEAEPARRKRLWHNAMRFLKGLRALGFDTLGSETPVIPVLVGDPARTFELTARLRDRGVYVCPAVPPMVQSHLSRIRAHVTAAHDDATLDAALARIGEVGRALGLTRARSAAPARAGRTRRAATAGLKIPSKLAI